MKNRYFLLMLSIFLGSFMISCEKEEEPEEQEEQIEVNEVSIIPSSTAGRPNQNLGCIEISSRITTIEVWDHGQIDGDIVSIIANGATLIDQQVLDGPNTPIRVDYDFGFNGFNYVTLFAHNLGSIAPNTCTIAINGVEFILEANLDTNGSIDVIVSGYGVDCSSSGGGNGGGNGGGGNGATTGDLIFYTSSDLGCGPINVNLNGVGSSTITGFYSGSAPDCSNSSAGGNFNDLSPGTYSFTASCSNLNWNGTVTIQQGVCTQQELLGGSGGGGGGGSGTGDVKFWINQDFGCGPITVNVSGSGSSTITGFFQSAPLCTNSSGGGNFNNLPVGNYSFTASCSSLSWNGNFSITEDNCLQFQLN